MSNFKLRVENTDIPIEVNDNGDMIYIRTDAAFMKSVAAIGASLKAEKDSYEKILREPGATQLQLDAAIESYFQNTEKAIDKVFGENTCQKVFGDNTRTILGYDSFMSQITNILEQAQTQSASKYMKNKGR